MIVSDSKYYYLVVSFILENVMASIFPATLGNISYFTTIYTIIALVVIYPYFANEKKYYTLVIIFGALFDILYTSTLLLNVVFFLLIALVIKIWIQICQIIYLQSM